MEWDSPLHVVMNGYIVKILELDENDNKTKNILQNYHIRASSKLEAGIQGSKRFKKTFLYPIYRHRYYIETLQL